MIVQRLLTIMFVAGALCGIGAHAAESLPLSLSLSLSLSFTPLGGTEQIPATLLKPEGAGPFAAIVMMHDCSGLGPRSSGGPKRWANELVAQGYVVLMPDSFSPRGFADGVCIVPAKQRSRVNGYVRAADAYGALAVLRTLPYVDGKRVGIMGGSHGGWTALAAMFVPTDTADPLAESKRNGFAAAIALYPSCEPRYGAWSTANTDSPADARYSGVYQPIAPLLILTGEKDDWTPAEPCRQLAERSRAAGHPVEIKIYPGAHHSFDNDRPVRYVAQRRNGRGATTGGDPVAWADAKKQVSAFFSLHLMQQKAR